MSQGNNRTIGPIDMNIVEGKKILCFLKKEKYFKMD
jgi:hypothetical protein